MTCKQLKALLAPALAAIALVGAGCASTPAGLTSERSPITLGRASLALRFAAPRLTQAQIFEVTGATVSILLRDRPAIEVPVATDSLEAFLVTVDDLPEGDAGVRLDVYRGSEVIGVGHTLVPLILGQRSSAFIQLTMDSRGQTDFMPLTPNLLPDLEVPR